MILKSVNTNRRYMLSVKSLTLLIPLLVVQAIQKCAHRLKVTHAHTSIHATYLPVHNDTHTLIRPSVISVHDSFATQLFLPRNGRDNAWASVRNCHPLRTSDKT